MPRPNPLNPIHCGRLMRKNGKQKSGAQQYRCECGYTCTDSDRPANRLGEKLATAMSAKERFKKYYLANKKKCKDLSRKRSRNYRLENREKYKEYFREYRLENREKYKEYFREYRLKNKEKYKEYFREYRLKNKEKYKEYFKKWYAKHKKLKE